MKILQDVSKLLRQDQEGKGWHLYTKNMNLMSTVSTNKCSHLSLGSQLYLKKIKLLHITDLPG